FWARSKRDQRIAILITVRNARLSAVRITYRTASGGPPTFLSLSYPPTRGSYHVCPSAHHLSDTQGREVIRPRLSRGAFALRGAEARGRHRRHAPARGWSALRAAAVSSDVRCHIPDARRPEGLRGFRTWQGSPRTRRLDQFGRRTDADGCDRRRL